MSVDNGKMHASPPAVRKSNATTPTSNKRELTNSNGIAAGLTKLSSLTPARDLTLGGRGAAGAAKKVFLPNLNVVRNKNANVKTSKDTTATRGGRGGRGKGDRGARGAGRGAGHSSLIQTTGVFSEGAGAIQLRKSTSGSYSSRASAAEEASASSLRKPMLLKSEDNKRFDMKAEAAHVRELLGADSDEDDFEDEKTDLEQIPIRLNEAKWKCVKTENVKLEVDVKAENIDLNGHNDADVAMANKIQSLHVQQWDKQRQQQQRTMSALSRYPQTVEELLQSTQSQIFLMQLPDTLPCEDDMGEEESADKSDNNKASTSSEAAAAAAAAKPPASKSNLKKGHSLKQMEEGQVGKLLRYKSGKVKLQLGETFFDLDMGMETGFLQDLMSISTNREERSGNMINLGPIQAKLTATPDWEHLLKQQIAKTTAEQQPTEHL